MLMMTAEAGNDKGGAGGESRRGWSERKRADCARRSVGVWRAAFLCYLTDVIRGSGRFFLGREGDAREKFGMDATALEDASLMFCCWFPLPVSALAARDNAQSRSGLAAAQRLHVMGIHASRFWPCPNGLHVM